MFFFLDFDDGMICSSFEVFVWIVIFYLCLDFTMHDEVVRFLICSI